MNTGEHIQFGQYNWRVLRVHGDRALIMTEDIIELRDYHNKNEEVTWSNCSLRHYLNEEFYESFAEVDRNRILEVEHENPGNPWYHVDGGPKTRDYVFILSMDEVVRDYFGDSSRLLDEPGRNQRYWFQRKDANNVLRRATFMNHIWWWWIRTPGKHNRVAVYIHGDGNIGIQGNGVYKRNTNVIHEPTMDTRGGIRPALWIKQD